MEKFSLFDLLSFAIPGGTSMVLIYWTISNSTEMRVSPLVIPEALLLVVLLMIAYFMGHLINDFGMRLESKIGALPKSWVEILESQPDLAQRLNEGSQQLFNHTFITPKGLIDEAASETFYSYAFHLLEVSGKMEKIRTLQSQYIFFRNGVVLSLIGFISFGIVSTVQLLQNKQNITSTVVVFPLMGMILSLLFARISRHISVKRRKMKMQATLDTFYAYYISETKF